MHIWASSELENMPNQNKRKFSKHLHTIFVGETDVLYANISKGISKDENFGGELELVAFYEFSS